MQTNLKIGDLVCLSDLWSEEASGRWGKGIVLAKHSHGDWEVYWFGERESSIESRSNIEIVSLPNSD